MYNWRDKAECADLDTEKFWAVPNERLAAYYCAACASKNNCLRYAVSKRVDEGVWGGYRFQRGVRRPLADPLPPGRLIGGIELAFYE